MIFINLVVCNRSGSLAVSLTAFLQTWPCSWGQCCMYPCFIVGKGQNCRTSSFGDIYKFGCLQQVWLFGGPTESFSASVAVFLGPMLYVSVFHRGQGGRTAGLPAWVIFINLVVCSRSGSLAAPQLLCRCGHLLGVNAVCIRVSSWARGRTAERVVVCSRSVAAPHSEHRLPAPSRRKDVVN